MKKKIFVIAVVLVVLIISVVLVFMWPRSFSKFISDNNEMRIVIVELNNDFIYENGQYNETTKEYVFNFDSVEFKKIQQILKNYSLHRPFRSLFNNTILLHQGLIGDGFLELHSDENRITVGGANEIQSNLKGVYRIGYFKSDGALTMLNEIKSILNNSEPSWEWNAGRFLPGNIYR